MKHKLILHYAITVVSLVSAILASISAIWALCALCGATFGYLISTAVLKTFEYLDYKRIERKVFENFHANKDKLIKYIEQEQFNYIFGGNNNEQGK